MCASWDGGVGSDLRYVGCKCLCYCQMAVVSTWLAERMAVGDSCVYAKGEWLGSVGMSTQLVKWQGGFGAKVIDGRLR
jgi:hypothetical protein